MSALSFIQISSSVNPSFWNKLSELKLNVYKLDESTKNIWGSYTIPNNSGLTYIEVDSTSFNLEVSTSIQHIPFHGKLYNKNSVEDFKECDKTKLLNNEGLSIWNKIKDNSALRNPSLLNCFMVLSFADLKKYHYYYWFAFPVPKDLDINIVSSNPINKILTKEQVECIYDKFKDLEICQRSHFLIITHKSELQVHKLEEKINDLNLNNLTNVYFVFYNISCDEKQIGSQLRNYVLLILKNCDFLQNQVVNFIALTLNRKNSSVGFWNSHVYAFKLPTIKDLTFSTWVGWELNERVKMGPRLANMRSSLDPLIIAEDAVDLNLKLMKWNVLPNVNLDKIKTSKYLLLGSGTLGCSVARTLLGWGVKYFTFVDNSTVSFSNPVRQSLFTYEDSVKMKPKAHAAADNLRKIFPGVNSKGIQMIINMPGHTVGDSMKEQIIKNIAQLAELIDEHDVIFLLMDSRESRWLPTLLGNYYNKIVINAALGFDSYLVMRHGIMKDSMKTVHGCPDGLKSISGSALGCYFCNDVTAPGNSLKGRTLDQQCTVTRPGVSQIAGALAAELAISILQHQKGIEAPAYYSQTDTTCSEAVDLNGSVLGLVPHSIRGFLHSFEQILPATEKYTNCVACSKMVLKEYEEQGTDFLMKVFNSSKHLEDVALLTEMFNETNFSEVLEFSDDDF